MTEAVCRSCYCVRGALSRAGDEVGRGGIRSGDDRGTRADGIGTRTRLNSGVGSEDVDGYRVACRRGTRRRVWSRRPITSRRRRRRRSRRRLRRTRKWKNECTSMGRCR
jgi:hypothetical protein